MGSNSKVIILSRHIAIVIDPWEFPYNGAVVSTRRFVQALEERYSFKRLATARLASNPRALFRNSDPADLAAKIDYWLANPRERLNEAKTVRKRPRSRTLSNSVAQFASVYDDYLAAESLADHGIAQVE